ncbi:MAG: alpha/beta hydrolase [Bacteroidota bacterium]|nr:alpha/beta hydrolase [Bacteroidota bacterium]
MKIDFKGKKINFDSKGEGKTVVFLHGFLENSTMWDFFADSLSRKFNVVVIDLPGHGESDVVAEIQSMELVAEVVKAVLDSLDIKKCMLVGHSMGGYASLAFADIYPAMLSGLVLFHSHAMEDNEQGKINRDRTVAIVEKNSADFVSMFIPDLFAPNNREKFNEVIERQKDFAKAMPKEGIIASLKGMKTRTSKLELLSQIDVPVMFIAGKEDSRIPVDKMMQQVALPKHSELLLLGDTGHMSWVEEEEKTAVALFSFVLRNL